MPLKAQGPAIRVLSAVGPGDVVGAFLDWKGGVRTASETSITFSSQEFAFFRRHAMPAWVISSNPRRQILQERGFRIENRAKSRITRYGAIGYHIAQVLYAISLWRSAVSFRATHAIIDSGTTHWFALILFRLVGIKVIPNFHNAYAWPRVQDARDVPSRVIRALDAAFFGRCVPVAIGVSPDGHRQLAALSSGRTRFVEYRAQFALSDFADFQPATLRAPNRVLFVGRIEAEKGVLLFLDVAERLSREAPGRFVFDVCGDGSARSQVEARLQHPNLSHVTFHGKLKRPQLLAMYRSSHIIVVPTLSQGSEGLPMVCAEAMIAGRPVVTSAVSNTLKVLAGAVVEATADDAHDYAEKIRRLSEDPESYRVLARNAARLGLQFTDGTCGLDACLSGYFGFDMDERPTSSVETSRELESETES